jgi:hypothetical protein
MTTFRLSEKVTNMKDSQGYRGSLLSVLVLGVMLISQPAQGAQVSVRADFALSGVSFQLFTSRTFTKYLGDSGILEDTTGAAGVGICAKFGTKAAAFCSFVFSRFGRWLAGQARATASAGNCILMEFIPLSPRAWSASGYWLFHPLYGWFKLHVQSYGGRYCSTT